MKLRSHTSKNTPIEHMMAFYKDFELLRSQHFDGMIITGAPVEQLEFDEVFYWPEMTDIFSWAKTHVTSTLYICWAAFAGMFHHYGIPKYDTPKKVFGVFEQHILKPRCPLFRGFDDTFFMPHSRHTECRREDIEKIEGLEILAESQESGVCISMAREGREIYITGHPEYSPHTLDNEYKRDLGKGLPIQVPENYYRDNDPDKGPLVHWRAHANLLYNNWINYYVYQMTPYDIDQIR
jgi:homoserine O-succinyltransferase